MLHSLVKDLNTLCDEQPFHTGWYLKDLRTGTTAQNFNDAGIIYHGQEPLFILTAYTDRVPVELPDGTPGHTAANQLIARLSRTCYDALRGKPGQTG